MKKIFGFGQIVRPTCKAFRSGIFKKTSIPIVGVVVYHSKKYAERLSVKIVIEGQKTARNYSVNFWENAPISWLKKI